MKPDVFISYAHADEEKARAIARFLERQRIRCWIDHTGLRLADGYDAKIVEAVRNSRVVLWLASNASLQSDYVRHEISTALAHHKTVGPVFLEPLDPERLKPPFVLSETRVHGIKYYKGTVEENLATLLDDLHPLIRPRRRLRGIAAGAALGAAVLFAFVTFLRTPEQTGLEPAPEHSVPASVSALPAGESLKIAYTGAPPSPTAAADPPRLELGIFARRKDEAAFHPLADGDTLSSAVDDYLIVARTHSGGHLYVFQVDASGRIDWLFPRNEVSEYSAGANPVSPGQQIQIPEAEQGRVLYLDHTGGIEHIYAVFSVTPWPALEQALATSSASVQPTELNQPGEASLALQVTGPNGLHHRGVGGTRVRPDAPGAVAPLELVYQGKAYAIPAKDQPYQSSSWFLVVERWFRHIERL